MRTMKNFERAVKVILKHEGGYVNHPNDPGGETNFGISKRSFPNEDIKNLTVERATEIYHEHFWKPLKLHLLSSEYLALHIFDHAVNAGGKTAVKMLQGIVETDQDGMLGPITAKAANCNAETGEKYVSNRIKFYRELTVKNPKLKVFLRGWMNRVESTYFP